LHLQVPDLGVSSPKFTTLGIPFGGQPVKHRQLALQVGERIEDPPANSMASFKFTSAMLPEGTTLIFGSWVCVTDGAHLGADRRDHWANLKNLFININPLKVADCYFVHMHRQIDSSSDP
jgi:EAL domain-containing protein (putative c-di-GMP-specific phosphodiesterase class I)